MARLTRKNIKVFADSASNNGVFGSLQAGNPTVTNDVETLQSLTAWDYGWNSATMTSEKLPPLEEIQGVTYVTTYQQAYLMQEGLPEWAATVTYYKGSLVKKVTTTGFQIYNSLTDDNINNQLSDTSNWKLVMDSDNLYALDNTVVHKAGAETITGAKTFEVNSVSADAFFIKNKAIEKGTAPSVSAHTRMYFLDKNGDNVACLYNNFADNGTNMLTMQVKKSDAVNDVSTDFSIAYPLSGSPYATFQGRLQIGSIELYPNIGETRPYIDFHYDNGSSDYTSRIIENNSGTLSFSGAIEVYGEIKRRNSNITKGTAPSTATNTTIAFTGNNEVALGHVYHNYATNKDSRTVLQASKANSSSDNTTASLGICYPASGNPYGYGPNSDVNGSLVTTVNKSKAASGYFQLGNGLIVQWGRTLIHVHSDKTVYTITLPKAFSTTNYTFCTCFENNTSSLPAYTDDVTFVTTSISTTQVKGFGFDAGNNYYDAYIRWIAIGY